jgi:DNA-binding response OmpR family regulator
MTANVPILAYLTGADDYLVKPYSRHEIVDWIRRLMDEWRGPGSRAG